MDLKQSTASQEILLGPFLDDDDGVTQKTGLTIANTDIKLFKTGGTTLGNKNSGGATEIATGFYYATLDATDTDTLGPLVIVVQMTDCLCVRHEFNVVSAAYYDWVYGSTKPSVDVDTIKTQAITADAFAADAIVAATLATGAITADAFAADAIVAATLATGALTADAFAANAITNAAVADDVDVNVKTMTAGVITSTVLADDCITAAKLNTDAIAADAFAQTAADKVWGTAARVLTAIDEDNTTLDLDATIASAVWNALTASYVGAGTTGKVISDTLADTNELQTDDTPTAIAALATTLGVAGAGLTAIPWNAAWDAEVQSECTDALNAYDPPTKAELDTAQGAVVVSASGIDAIFDRASSLTLSFETLITRIYQILNNAMTINETTGAVSLKALGSGAEIAAGDVDSAAGTTDRDELTWA